MNGPISANRLKGVKRDHFIMDVSGVFMKRADLTGANLENANLADANAQFAIFVGANFKNTNLAGTNLCGADLTDAVNLTESQLGLAVLNSGTKLPDYIDRSKIAR
jgi:serine/threonine-protein kinase